MPGNIIRLGISSCLLGKNVRYDGENKRYDILIDALGEGVEWVPVCPEVEAGFSVPREAVRLTAPRQSPRIVTVDTGVDHTDRILSQINTIISKLAQQHIGGFIFKSKSPSCGLRDIPIYDIEGKPCGKGVGIFADQLVKQFPFMPVADDAQLADKNKRKCFMDKAVRFDKQRSDL